MGPEVVEMSTTTAAQTVAALRQMLAANVGLPEQLVSAMGLSLLRKNLQASAIPLSSCAQKPGRTWVSNPGLPRFNSVLFTCVVCPVRGAAVTLVIGSKKWRTRSFFCW